MIGHTWADAIAGLVYSLVWLPMIGLAIVLALMAALVVEAIRQWISRGAAPR